MSFFRLARAQPHHHHLLFDSKYMNANNHISPKEIHILICSNQKKTLPLQRNQKQTESSKQIVTHKPTIYHLRQ